MADAHLPNCHPSVTPAWKPSQYKPTPFRQAITANQVTGKDDCFEGYTPRDWSVPGMTLLISPKMIMELVTDIIYLITGDLGLVAHGGFICALIIETSKKYFFLKHGARKQPDPVHLHVQYLNPVPHGPINIALKDIKIGMNHSVIQVELNTPKSLNSSVLAIVTHGNLSVVGGHSISTPLLKLPDRQTECRRWSNAFFYHVNPTSAQFRGYTPGGDSTKFWSPAIGQNARDMWVKLDDEKDTLNSSHLGLLADLVSNYCKTVDNRV
jgi:hypothetical protein